MNKRYLGLALLGSSIAFALAATTASILPTASGNYSAWTPSTGTTHYTLVDETTCNGVTDYVSTTGVGSRDSYAVSLTSVPNGATITGISITPCASKNKSGGSSAMSVFYRLDGVDSADSGTYTLSGTTPVALSSSNYTSLSVVKNAGTALEIGAVLSSGTAGARLSNIATVVTYTPAPTFTINSSASANGSISPTGTTTVAQGGNQSYTITPNSGYYISSLVVDGTSTSATSSYMFTNVQANHSIIASFTLIPTAPSSPTNPHATATSTNIILVTWTDTSANETGFSVERSGDGINFSEIATTTANTTSYWNFPLSSGTYYYRLRSFNGVGYSDYSSTVNATLP